MSVHGLCVYRSNRLERLAEALAEQLAEPPEDPFAPECILVPGRGVAQWLSLELSQRFGVWANVLYLYPRNFVGWALERVLESPAAGLEAFDPERLLWSIVSTLRPLLERSEFEAIQRYVSADASDVRYFELCRRIASTFDRYAAYRPDLLTSWERKARPSTELPQLGLFGTREPQDEAQGWQALLWKALVERSGSVAMGTLERRFLRRVQRSQRLDNLPARISCFGVTHVPPSYARILVALCPHVPVRMFQLAASRRVEPARHHPLLESLGALATDFEALLADELKQQGVPVSSVALFDPPTAPTRLARLQRELLEDVAPGSSPARGAADDESIRIHVCHSPMREVEVLHDQLLALLSSDSGYEARDVVVMMPDIETYAPLIDAVFRRASDDPQRIPYSLADRVLEAAAPVASALDRLFLLAGQRLSTSQVLDLLALEVVAARFELTPRDLEQITEWLQRTNVRWGIDADHREAHGHPRSDANTWRLGVRRLLLGYAMSLDPPALVSGILPETGPSGSGAAALGKLASFLESLFQHLHALGQPHRASEWPELVSAALEALVQHDADTAWQHQELLQALRALTGRAIEAGYDQPIGSAALHGLLFEAVNGARPARGFLMGGVTFCSMVPLRSIPFRVVCLVGLGDGDFPRQDATTDFDLIVHGPGGRRRGDRSRRMEDRYIFLEAILAARERLIITYTGQSIRDNSSLPPSVVVAELCDYLDAEREPAPAAPDPEQSSTQSSRPSSAEGAPDYIVSHPLQAFSPRYFDASDARLFSYAAHYAAANRARYRAPLAEFFVGPLTAPPPDALALAELVRFYRGPAAYLLNRRLELYLRESGEALADREPLELSGLESYAVGQSLLELGRRGVSPAQARELVMAGGALPLGTPGELDFQEISSCANRISELAADARAGGRQPPLPFQARLPSGRVLFGSLNESYAHGLVEQQFARIRAAHLLSLWIRHLVYCWVAPGGAQAHSSLFGRPLQGGGAVHQRFRPVEDPALRLDALARRFDQGQALPLLLFPTTSLAYAQAARSVARGPGGKRDAFAGLDKEWQLELQRDSHLQRVYGADKSFAELRREHQAEFEQLAIEIFEPLLTHLESEEHGEA